MQPQRTPITQRNLIAPKRIHLIHAPPRQPAHFRRRRKHNFRNPPQTRIHQPARRRRNRLLRPIHRLIHRSPRRNAIQKHHRARRCHQRRLNPRLQPPPRPSQRTAAQVPNRVPPPHRCIDERKRQSPIALIKLRNIRRALRQIRKRQRMLKRACKRRVPGRRRRQRPRRRGHKPRGRPIKIILITLIIARLATRRTGKSWRIANKLARWRERFVVGAFALQR